MVPAKGINGLKMTDVEKNSKSFDDASLDGRGWITVVVPAFNRSDFVLHALESIRHQSFRPIEIVVVDDGSTDDTLQIVREWAKQYVDPQRFVIRWVSQTNQGANAARNRGIKESHGEYIAFLDSDDQWLPEKLVKQIAILKKDIEIGGVYCGMRNIDLSTGAKDNVSPRTYPAGNLLRQLLIHDVTEATSSWVVRKACFDHAGAFDTTLPARQDWDMWIRLSEKYRIGCVPEVMVELGNHAGERVRSDPQREITAHQVIFHKYRHLRAQFPLWVSLASRSAMYRRRGRVHFHRGLSKKSAFRMYLLSIMVWPFTFDSYAALLGMIFPKRLREKIHIAWNSIFGRTRLAIKSH
ncbi:glycosyltransferase family A protein [Desulfococcaceae bacterium HSG7]|nr:glycosyltransferase family A protein [Desulfococcaceae bacterium HSG7]